MKQPSIPEFYDSKKLSTVSAQSESFSIGWQEMLQGKYQPIAQLWDDIDKPEQELVDDENPAWTDEMFSQAKQGAKLFPKLRGKP